MMEQTHTAKQQLVGAGQAATIADNEEKPIIATTNVKHLSRFAQAAIWDQIT